jgi:hypothetical protein
MSDRRVCASPGVARRLFRGPYDDELFGPGFCGGLRVRLLLSRVCDFFCFSWEPPRLSNVSPYWAFPFYPH